MRDFFKSKFFALLVVIALVLTIVPSVLYAMGVGNYTHNIINTILAPAQKGFTFVTNALDGFTSYFTEFDRIVEENKALRQRINELEDQIYSAKEIEGMNQWLFDYLELKREHTDYVFEAANITGGGGGNYMTVFTIDRGKNHDVTVDMPVITPEGIVGYVVESGSDWSKVVTFIEAGSSIGAYIERTGELCVVEGDYTLSKEGICRINYLTEESDIQEGDRILSSGYGNVYPRGLIIGHVSKVERDEYSRSVVAYITPAADLTDISKLMVITEYETYSE
ncbi:MAG: rod shape-determining protein MreC [Clostridia bacterium]|nr:rod shape-determining protein MreC [Clostridia bacterium]